MSNCGGCGGSRCPEEPLGTLDYVSDANERLAIVAGLMAHVQWVETLPVGEDGKKTAYALQLVLAAVSKAICEQTLESLGRLGDAHARGQR